MQSIDPLSHPRIGLSLFISLFGNVIAWSILLLTRHVASPAPMFELIPLFLAVLGLFVVEVVALIALMAVGCRPAGRLYHIALLLAILAWPMFIVGIVWLI